MSKNTDKKDKPKTTRPGSGRTKGSFSFVVVPLSELAAMFTKPDMPIVISRKWAEQVGIKVQGTTDANHLFGSIQGNTPATVVGATVSELD